MGIFDKIFKKEDVNVSKDIYAVVTGTLIPLSDVPDPVFAKEVMGKSLAFAPRNGRICAPADGEIVTIFPTGHAFGMVLSDGTELLVHIGINTVSMDGKGFHPKKKEGDKVKAGEMVVDVDIEEIEKAGFSPITMLIITNQTENREYNFINLKEIQAGEKISL